MNWLIKRLLPLTVAFTVLSQMPYLMIRMSISTQMISMPLWMLTFILLVFDKKILIMGRYSTWVYICSISTLFFLMFYTLIAPENLYFSASLTSSLIISLFVFLVGNLSTPIMDEDLYQSIRKSFIVSSMILLVDVFFEYFQGYSFSTITYVYTAKNSAAQILETALVLILFYGNENQQKRIHLKIFRILLSVIFFVMILYLRSRATIVSLLLIPLVYYLKKDIGTIKKVLLLFFAIFTGWFLLTNDDAISFISNIIFNSKTSISNASLDLDWISSGRISQIINAWNLFQDNWLIGVGNYYVDMFPINSLVDYGVIVGAIVILLGVSPVFQSLNIWKNSTLSENRKIEILLIASIYVFNSVFEAIAPFGPGSKCFFLWFILGCFSSNLTMGCLDRK